MKFRNSGGGIFVDHFIFKIYMLALSFSLGKFYFIHKAIRLGHLPQEGTECITSNQKL